MASDSPWPKLKSACNLATSFLLFTRTTSMLDSSTAFWIISASKVFFGPQHSLATSPGIATRSLTPARNRARNSALVTRISVDASRTNIMTIYYNRNDNITRCCWQIERSGGDFPAGARQGCEPDNDGCTHRGDCAGASRQHVHSGQGFFSNRALDGFPLHPLPRP